MPFAICSFDYGEALFEMGVVSFVELQQFWVLSVTPQCCGHEPWIRGWFRGCMPFPAVVKSCLIIIWQDS